MGLNFDIKEESEKSRILFSGSMDESAEQILMDIKTESPTVIFNFDELEFSFLVSF